MSGFPMTIAAVNDLFADDFVAIFGDVAEHSPWVAEKALDQRPFSDRPAMMGAFVDAVLEAPDALKLELIRAHPDLAGRAAVNQELADESRREQAGAGLDTLTQSEFERFSEFNSRYREKFLFPFILAVKGADKAKILGSFEDRLKNDPDEEFANAIRQIARIVAFRIDDRVSA